METAPMLPYQSSSPAGAPGTPPLLGEGPAARPIPAWVLALIALLAFAVYANSLKNAFAFDDAGIVSGSRHVQSLEWTAIWTDGYWPKAEGLIPDALYRPLTIWTYLANQAILPDVAWPFHLVNVLLHALVSVLATLLTWRLLGRRSVAILTGVLFAVHPLHTEVVANVVGRAELLAALWSLLALLIFLPVTPLANAAAPVIRTSRSIGQMCLVIVAALAGAVIGERLAAYSSQVIPFIIYGSAVGVGAGLLLAGIFARLRPAPPAAELRPWWHGVLVALCMLAAVLCKETPVLLVLVLMMVDAWRWVRWPRAVRPGAMRWFATQAVRYYAPIYAAMGVYAWLRIHAVGIMSDTAVTHRVVNPLIDATIPERIVTPFMLLAKYLCLTFWPVHLSADYSAPSLMPDANPFYGTAFQPPAALGMLACVLAVIVAKIAWKKTPQIVIILGLFASAYVLVANFVRIGTIFGERLFYWPSTFVIMLAAWGGVEMYERMTTASEGQPAPPAAAVRNIRFAALGLVAVALAAMGYRTWIRNPDWAENTALAISTARDNPASGKACSWAGSILAMSPDPQYSDIGRTLMERGVELTPDYVVVRWELAKYYGMRGQLGKSVIYLAQAAEIDPGRHETRIAMEAVLIDLRDEAPERYMPVLLDYEKAHPDEPSIHLALALAYHAQKKWDDAEENARQALDLETAQHGGGVEQFHEAGAELATIKFDRGDIDGGIQAFGKYLVWMGGSLDAHCAYAHMLLSADLEKHPQFLEAAERNLDLCDRIEPRNPRTRQERGELDRLLKGLADGDRGATANADVDKGLPDFHQGPPAPRQEHAPAGGGPP